LLILIALKESNQYAGFWGFEGFPMGSQHVLKFSMCSQLLSSLNLIYLGQYWSFICHMNRMNIWESPKFKNLFLGMGQSKRLIARKIKIKFAVII
jgi:hypothetical protein